MPPLYYVAPFDDTRINSFVLNWYTQHEAHDATAADQAHELMQAIRDHEGTHKLSRIPNLLTLMALIHRVQAKLPHGRVRLYDRIAEAYLESIDEFRKLQALDYSLAQKKRSLAAVAYRMQLRRTVRPPGDSISPSNDATMQREILVSRTQIHEWLVQAMKSSVPRKVARAADEFLDYLTRRSGLLVPRLEGHYAFMHLSFQEYFAAHYLAQRLSAPRFSSQPATDPTDSELRTWATQPAWKETIVFLFEMLAEQASGWSNGLLEHLFGKSFLPDTSHDETPASELLAELAVDPYSGLNADARQRARNAAWRWEIKSWQKGGLGYRMRVVARTLIDEHHGDLERAWRSAGLDIQSLKLSVRSLSLEGCAGLTDLTMIGHLSQLTRLRLKDCTRLNDIRPISKLEYLKELDLLHCISLVDIQALADLGNIEELVLTNCRGISDLSPLSRFKKIQRLYLAGSSVQSLAPISDLTSLRVLGVNGLRAIDDLSSLARLPQLTSLTAEGTAIENLFPLRHLTKLSSLSLGGCSAITDIAPLGELASLNSLGMLGCVGIRDVRSLSRLPLEYLDLRGCSNISDLSPLERIVTLKSLRIDQPQAGRLSVRLRKLRSTPESVPDPVRMRVPK